LERHVSDLLIRKLSPAMRRRIRERAKRNRRSLSEEAKSLIERGLTAPPGPSDGFGTWLFSLVRDEDRGDDLVFEVPGEIEPPPDFR
jgi:hypothetical protein